MNPSVNNSFGGNEREPIVSSGSGDVYYSMMPKKSNKKMWIFVTLLVVLIVVVILAVMNMPKSSVVVDGKDSFNEYANYFVNGEASKVEFDAERKDLAASFVGKKISEGQDASAELNTAWGYFNNFYSEYIKVVEENSYTATLLESYGNKLRLVNVYYGGEDLKRADIVKAYLEGGDERARMVINEKIAKYSEIPQIYSMSYYGLIKDWGEQNLALIKKYQDFGCIKDNEIDYDCAVQNVNDETIELSDKMSIDYYDMKLILNKSEKDLYYDIFEIKSIVYGEGRNVTE